LIDLGLLALVLQAFDPFFTTKLEAALPRR
jgi:hypothetical protein